jgi:hypothetical protein
LTVTDQGRLTGTLSFTTWMVTAAMHPLVGSWLDRTQDWPSALALAGLPPTLGLIVLLLFWGRPKMQPAEVYPVPHKSQWDEASTDDTDIREPAAKIKCR